MNAAADRALVDAALLADIGLADSQGEIVSAAEFAEIIEHRRGKGITYSFTPGVVRALLAERDQLVEQLAAVTRQRDELDRRVSLAVSGLSDVERDDPVEEYGRAVDQALADLRGER